MQDLITDSSGTGRMASCRDMSEGVIELNRQDKALGNGAGRWGTESQDLHMKVVIIGVIHASKTQEDK